MNKKHRNQSSFYQRFGDNFSAIIFSAIFSFFLIRLFEFFSLSLKHNLPPNAFSLELVGFAFDIVLVLKLAAIILIPFILLYLIKNRIGNTVLVLMLVLFSFAYISLIIYFNNTFLLLGADLYGYSFDEIIKISSAGDNLSFINLIPFIGILLIIFVSFQLLSKISYKSPVITILIVLCVISFFAIKFLRPSPERFKNDMNMSLVTSKLDYFLTGSWKYFFKKEEISFDDVSMYDLMNESDTSRPENFVFLNEDYPLLHTENTPDELGQYFQINPEIRPNFVFIIVESLGRAYSGENAANRSFTPFLDSLMKKSLYWENFLSTSGRTFEVLPSLFGSLPYGKTGFCEMGEKMPKHQSMLKLLSVNGYQTMFIHGGDAGFDNMSLFLRKNRITRIIEEKDFGTGYKKMPGKPGNGFSWGYGDLELFKKGLQNLSLGVPGPYLHIYLTLSMHDPYNVNNQELYNKKFEAHLKKLVVPQKEMADYRNYTKEYASVLYFDDALRYFITEYSKRPEFSNTIFIITGDHRMSTPPISTQLDRFHVPFVIYSPMLKKSQKFSSVSSHLDVTPSILAFLENNYHVKIPGYSHWLGHGIDMSIDFRNIHGIPFIRNKPETVDYLYKTHMLCNNNLYKLYNKNYIEITRNDELKSTIDYFFNAFKSVNIFVCDNDLIAPDSLVNFGLK